MVLSVKVRSRIGLSVRRVKVPMLWIAPTLGSASGAVSFQANDGIFGEDIDGARSM